VARAKRTERAAARRRYRAATADVAATEGDDSIETPAVPAAALPRGYRDRRPASASGAATSTARPGFLGTLRIAGGTLDVPGDIRALPSLLVSRAAWAPALVILVTTVALLIPSLASNQFVVLAGNVILQPPPMIIAFLAGMLAARGAWLMGGLMSLLAGLAYVLVISINTDYLVTPLGFTYLVPTEQKIAYAQSVLVTAPLFGVAVGAFAGFYRRFLNLSSPQRQQQSRKR
jgi:hypothetical protein